MAGVLLSGVSAGGNVPSSTVSPFTCAAGAGSILVTMMGSRTLAYYESLRQCRRSLPIASKTYAPARRQERSFVHYSEFVCPLHRIRA